MKLIYHIIKIQQIVSFRLLKASITKIPTIDKIAYDWLKIKLWGGVQAQLPEDLRGLALGQ